VEELDLSAIYAVYERKDNRGQLGYHSLVMVRLLVYGYAKGITSSRRIETATREEIAFRYLAANQHPDHDTIAAFRQHHLESLAGLFVEVLRLCQKAGLAKLGNVAIDGTKMMANASANRNFSFGRLSEREMYWLEVVNRMMAEAQQVDQEEDKLYGKGQTESALPADLAEAKQRLARIRQAKQELLEEARQQMEAAEKEKQAIRASKPGKDATPQEKDLYNQKRDRAKKRLERARATPSNPAVSITS
jgi:transposase